MTTTSNKVRPLADRVVVQALAEAEQTRGGLYIPDTAKEKPQQGKVISVGPGKFSEHGERIATGSTRGRK
jgi:chaperonin GroES